MSDDLNAIHDALVAGDKRQARQLLKPLLDSAPSADLWLLAADACEAAEKELGCLRQALKLDPNHPQARQRYTALRQSALLSTQEMPSLETLTSDLENIQPELHELVQRPIPPLDVFALKRQKKQESRRRWNRIGCAASLLMSLSLSYFVLTVLGAPITAQIRQFLSGSGPAAPAEGTPIFGRPNPTSENLSTGSVVNDPAALVNATSIPAILTSSPTRDPADQTYADEAAQSGFVVSPNKSAVLRESTPVSDILDPGFAHEYSFSVPPGGEIALAIQFFSPTAKNVSANVAILDPDGVNAEAHCQRDTILVDGSSIAFICQAHKGGNWKVQIFGRAGESTGVYVMTYEIL